MVIYYVRSSCPAGVPKSRPDKKLGKAIKIAIVIAEFCQVILEICQVIYPAGRLLGDEKRCYLYCPLWKF